ncbi:YkvA family protein [Pedococcus bigeumensis]|uniref:YkvA family protein n=1 Tax=Pedococcus bigeumensis TaxID=433644 RepID=UPI001F4FDAA3|nr:DUF1232 domain-containing protein [Pedococcus bigeumensis]
MPASWSDVIAPGPWWSLAAAVGGGLVLLWVTLVAALWVVRPDDLRLREALRLLPDVVRLLRRLAVDSAVPRGARVRLWLLLAYLASPIDVVPDFLPVIGYADDAILVAVVLRSVTRRAGAEALERHWPGTPQGLEAVRTLAGLHD